jgi:hypothetical protein
VTFDDIGYGILAQADFAADQAITASLCDKRYRLRGEPGYGDSLLNPFLDRGRDALNHRNKASKGFSHKRG